jgi:hypothetical protein
MRERREAAEKARVAGEVRAAGGIGQKELLIFRRKLTADR